MRTRRFGIGLAGALVLLLLLLPFVAPVLLPASARGPQPRRGGAYRDATHRVFIEVAADARSLALTLGCRGSGIAASAPIAIRGGGRFAARTSTLSGPLSTSLGVIVRPAHRRARLAVSGRFTSADRAAGTVTVGSCRTRFTATAYRRVLRAHVIVGCEGDPDDFPADNDFDGDHLGASTAHLARPTTICADRSGGYYVADTLNGRIRHVDRLGRIDTVVGSGAMPGGPWCVTDVPAEQACLGIPHGIDVAADGALIVADTGHHRIDRVGRDGILRTIAGTGSACDHEGDACGEGGPPLAAKLFLPTIAHDTPAGLVIADSRDRVLLVRHGRVDRIAGTGHPGASGDGGPATDARLFGPADAVPYRGGWLISDGSNCRLRWVDPHGIIHPFAGYGTDLAWCHRAYALATGGWSTPIVGDLGDGGPAWAARLSVTGFLATQGSTVWVTDFLNARVRKIERGRITTVLGTGRVGANGDGPLAGTSFRLGWPSGIARLPDGRILVTDPANNRVIELR